MLSSITPLFHPDYDYDYCYYYYYYYYCCCCCYYDDDDDNDDNNCAGNRRAITFTDWLPNVDSLQCLQGVGRTATNIVKVAREEHEEKGVTGAVGGVLRQLPPTIVQPVILATQATSSVLGGVRNQILPDARREAAEKWRQTDHT